MLRRVLERRALHQQSNREISAQGHDHVPGRDAVWSLLDLTHDTCPAAQRQQFGAQVVRALIVCHTEPGERVCDRVEGAATGGAIVGDHPRQPVCPFAALGRQRRPIDLQKAAVDAEVLFRHRPVRESLIKITSQEANQRRMNPGVGVDAAHRLQPVAVANRRGRDGRRRRTRATYRVDASAPHAADRSPLFARAIVELAEVGQRRAGMGWHIGSKARQRCRFLQDPRKFPAGRCRNAVQHDRPPEIEARSDAGHVARASCAQVFVDHGLDILREDPAGRQLVAVA